MAIDDKLILVSEQPADIDFFSNIAQALDLSICVCIENSNPAKYLSTSGHNLILYDLEEDSLTDSVGPRSFQALQDALRDSALKARLLSLSSRPLHLYPEFFGSGCKRSFHFSGNIVRKYTAGAERLFPEFVKLTLNPCHQGLSFFFGAETAVSAMTLTRAKERKSAVDGIESFLIESATDPRMASKVAQCADELIMNAIFDAPRDERGRAGRNQLARTEDFALTGKASVDLEIASNDLYYAIAVTDRYGSLDPAVILRHLGQNYQGTNYSPDHNSVGAGLGIYNSVVAGFSLLYLYEAGVRTTAIVFFEKFTSSRRFKQGFQFTACLGIS